jgi:chromosome segregation ATPase
MRVHSAVHHHRHRRQLRADLQNAKIQSMDKNETVEHVIEALQEQVHVLQNEQYAATQKGSAAEMELTKLRDRNSQLSLQRTKLTLLTTNQTELITDLQGQLDSMYAAYSMQEAEIRSIQDDFRTTRHRLEHADMTLIRINEKIHTEAQKQRDQGDLNAAKVLEALDIGAFAENNAPTPRESGRHQPQSVARATARPAGGR